MSTVCLINNCEACHSQRACNVYETFSDAALSNREINLLALGIMKARQEMCERLSELEKGRIAMNSGLVRLKSINELLDSNICYPHMNNKILKCESHILAHMRKQKIQNPFQTDHALVQARFVDKPESECLAPKGQVQKDKWDFQPRNFVLEPNWDDMDFVHSNIVHIGTDRYTSDSDISEASIQDWGWNEKKIRRDKWDINNPEMVIGNTKQRAHSKQSKEQPPPNPEPTNITQNIKVDEIDLLEFCGICYRISSTCRCKHSDLICIFCKRFCHICHSQDGCPFRTSQDYCHCRMGQKATKDRFPHYVGTVNSHIMDLQINLAVRASPEFMFLGRKQEDDVGSHIKTCFMCNKTMSMCKCFLNTNTDTEDEDQMEKLSKRNKKFRKRRKKSHVESKSARSEEYKENEKYVGTD